MRMLFSVVLLVVPTDLNFKISLKNGVIYLEYIL